MNPDVCGSRNGLRVASYGPQRWGRFFWIGNKWQWTGLCRAAIPQLAPTAIQALKPESRMMRYEPRLSVP